MLSTKCHVCPGTGFCIIELQLMRVEVGGVVSVRLVVSEWVVGGWWL